MILLNLLCALKQAFSIFSKSTNGITGIVQKKQKKNNLFLFSVSRPMELLELCNKPILFFLFSVRRPMELLELLAEFQIRTKLLYHLLLL